MEAYPVRYSFLVKHYNTSSMLLYYPEHRLRWLWSYYRSAGCSPACRIGPVNTIYLLFSIAFFQQCAASRIDFHLYARYPEIIYSTDRDLAAGLYRYNYRHRWFWRPVETKNLPSPGYTDFAWVSTRRYRRPWYLVLAFYYSLGIAWSQQESVLCLRLSRGGVSLPAFRRFRQLLFLPSTREIRVLFRGLLWIYLLWHCCWSLP